MPMKTMKEVMQLRAEGRYLDALRAYDNLVKVEADQVGFRAIKADLLELVGRHSQARLMAEQTLKSPRLTASERARCLYVISKVLFEHGKTDEAFSFLQRASTLCQKAATWN